MIDPLITRYEEIRTRYTSLGSTYSDLSVLQDIRTDLTILFGDFGRHIGDYKFARNQTEHMRSVTLSCQILEETNRSEEKITASKAELLARCSPTYEAFLNTMSGAYSDWELIKHYVESVKLLLFTVGSHMDNLKQ